MAVKMKFEEFISDMKSITQIPMFSLSPAKKSDREDGDVRKDDKVKTKILEAWNNIRYDLGPIATLKKDTPIWILGFCHHSRQVTDPTSVEAKEEDNMFDSPLDRQIYTDFASRPRFTYRKNFPPISGTDITTDTGWGCMLRSAQMMIAQGLLLHFLGRKWRWLTDKEPPRRSKNLHKEIIGWFIDDPSCPLSIHRLSEIGRKFGNMPGNWYGPNTAAHIMQNAVKEAEEKHPKLKQVAVYVAVDCTVYSEDVYDICDWRNSLKTAQNLDEKSSKKIYSSISSGSLKLLSHDDILNSVESSPSLNNVFSVEPTMENVDSRTNINKKQSANADKDAPDHNERRNVAGKPTSHEYIDSLVSTKTPSIDKGSVSPSPGPTQNAEDHLHFESWCEVPEVVSNESYEDFKKHAENKKPSRKFILSMKKNKKEKISLYKNDAEIDDSKSNGRIVIPHFQVDNRKQTSKTSNDSAAESFMMSSRIVTSQTSNKTTKWNAVQQKLKIDNDMRNQKTKHAVVTPETPSPILFRRENTKTGESEILRSPDIFLSKHSIFKWDEPTRSDCQDDFLSSYIEPVTPESKSSDVRPATVRKMAKFEVCTATPYTTSKIDEIHQKVSVAKSLSQNSQTDDCSLEYKYPILSTKIMTDDIEGENRSLRHRNVTDSNPASLGTISNTQPIPIEQSNTRGKSKVLRRSSSTPDFRPRSSTTGESPRTPRGSEKYWRKRSVPGTKTEHHKAVLILIPVRLGESALNPIYAPCVEAMLSLGSTIGIIGGKPKHSLYFVGCQGQGLLHLDPHYCQQADTPAGYAKNLHDYHTTQIRKVNVKKMDPSCCLGFYCRTPDEFEEFKIQSQKNFTPPKQTFGYPMCLIMEGRSGDNVIKTPAMSDEFHEPNLSKNTSSFDIGVDVGDAVNSSVRKKSFLTVEKQDSDTVRLKKKKKGDVFRMDDVSSTLNKLNPLAKLMRKSPTPKRRTTAENEELESQFEFL